MNLLSHRQRRAEFVRGFFLYLREQQIPSAVLHGGEEGFEGELSDVDFVIDPSAFEKLANLIHSYCTQSGWRLCQILRHETTAAFCVCSANDDPACAVALDACSDYQRNGTRFLSANSLLENMQPLAWGGAALSPNMELRYRFAKAAAKNKNPQGVTTEFLKYPEEVHKDCELWLRKHWRINLTNWNFESLATALQQLHQKSNLRPPIFQIGSLARIARRVSHPTGLVVVTGTEEFYATSTLLESVFGQLYFRRFLKADHWRPRLITDLISSTLIVTPELESPWTQLLPNGCLYRLNAGQEADALCQGLTHHLHERCRRWEHL